MPPWEKYQTAPQSSGKPWEKYGAPSPGSYASPEDALDALGTEGGAIAPVQTQPQGFFNNLAQTRVTPGDRPGLADVAVNTIGQIGAHPIQAIADTISAPQRAVSGFIGASEDLAQGNFKAAGRQALEGLTAAGETALLVAPGASAASRAAGVTARPAARTAAQQFVADAERVGVRPTLPAANPTGIARISKPLSENAILGATTREESRKVVDEVKTAVEKTASLYSDADYRQAGRSAIKGVTDQLEKRSAAEQARAPFATFREKAGAVYEKAFSKIDLKAEADPVATRAVLAEVTSRFDNQTLNEIFRLPTSSKIAETLQNGGKLSVNDIRQLRTTVREMGNLNRLNRSLDDAALERLEGSLTQDLFAGIEATSGKAAARELRVADRFYRQNITSIKEALKPFFKNGLSTEDAFREIVASSQGVRGDIRQIRALRRSLTPQQMDDVSAGLVRQLGKPNGKDEQFSLITFANNWEKMNPEAKAALFNRAQRPEVREQLDALANVVSRNAQVEKLANVSQSGASAGNIASLAAASAGIFKAPVATISGIVGANAFGRLLMSPSFTRMMVNMERRAGRGPIDLRNARDKAFIFTALTAAENSDAAIKPYIRDIRQALEAENDNLVKQEQKTAN